MSIRSCVYKKIFTLVEDIVRRPLVRNATAIVRYKVYAPAYVVHRYDASLPLSINHSSANFKHLVVWVHPTVERCKPFNIGKMVWRKWHIKAVEPKAEGGFREFEYTTNLTDALPCRTQISKR